VARIRSGGVGSPAPVPRALLDGVDVSLGFSQPSTGRGYRGNALRETRRHLPHRKRGTHDARSVDPRLFPPHEASFGADWMWMTGREAGPMDERMDKPTISCRIILINVVRKPPVNGSRKKMKFWLTLPRPFRNFATKCSLLTRKVAGDGWKYRTWTVYDD
jgi:hypothetical protein